MRPARPLLRRKRGLVSLEAASVTCSAGHELLLYALPIYSVTVQRAEEKRRSAAAALCENFTLKRAIYDQIIAALHAR